MSGDSGGQSKFTSGSGVNANWRMSLKLQTKGFLIGVTFFLRFTVMILILSKKNSL